MNEANTEKTTICLNCQQQLQENMKYCSNCGQRALPKQLTLNYFFREFISNVFSIDSKFLKTIKFLFWKPSFLSIEFIEGRRIRYINPIQLFLFSSFLFFLVNSLMFLKENPDDQEYFTLTDGEKAVVVDSLDIKKADSLYIVGEGAKADTLDNAYIGEFLQKAKDFNALDKEQQNEKIGDSISVAVFLLMPIFALYLSWFFRVGKRPYLENFVFSLHFHSFYYFLGIVFILVDKLLPGDTDIKALNLLVIIYLLLAVKRFYTLSWTTTLLRYSGLVFLYGLTVSVFLIASILISILI